MSLHTWWLRQRLVRVERQAKRLRVRQRVLRERESRLVKKGASAEDVAALHEEREAVTAKLNDVLAREERIKDELKTAERGGAAAT